MFPKLLVWRRDRRHPTKQKLSQSLFSDPISLGQWPGVRGAWLITTSQHSWECSGEWGSGSIHSGLRSCAATMYFQPEVLLSVTLSVVNKTVRSVCSDKKNIQMIRYNNEPETGLTLSFQVSTICTLTFMKQTQLLYNELSHFTDWKHKFKCKICDIFCEIWKLSKKSVAPSEFNFSFNRTENV